MASNDETAALRGLTAEQAEAFSRRAYTLDNLGFFYERGLIEASRRDTATGRGLRATLESLSQQGFLPLASWRPHGAKAA